MSEETVEVPVELLERVLDAYDAYVMEVAANDEPYAANYEAEQLRRLLPEPADPDAELVDAMALAISQAWGQSDENANDLSFGDVARAALAAYREVQEQ